MGSDAAPLIRSVLPFLSTMKRETTISVSNEEKSRLDDVKRQLFGTDEVPYGVVVAELTDRVGDAGE